MDNDGDEEKNLTFQHNSFISRDSQQCKLVGRSAEESVLLNAYFASLSSISISSEVPAAVVLICGESGQGKTKLALTLRQTVLEDDGYFIRGKFDQNMSCHGSSSAAAASQPYSIISSALREYCFQLKQRKHGDWREVADAMRREIRPDERHLLSEAIPALRNLLFCGEKGNGKSCRKMSQKEKDGEEVGNSFAESRSHQLHYLTKKLLRVIARIGEPIIFLIDDMQWADASSLEILRKLVLGATNPFTFIFTYRPIDASHPFSNVLSDFSTSDMRITEIVLRGLKKRQVCELVMNILRLDQFSSRDDHRDCMSLSNFVFHATNGNPLFVQQQILLFCDEGLLQHNGNNWDRDIEKIKNSYVLDDIVSVIFGKMKKMPVIVQKILVICACIGSKVDLDILYILARNAIDYFPNGEERNVNTLVENALSTACEEGLLVQYRDGMAVHFFHDSIQSAAYSLVQEDGRASWHLHLGRTLMEHFQPNRRKRYLLTIANQLARGQDLITADNERVDVAHIFLGAGAESIIASAPGDAVFYFSRGIKMLRDDDWSSNYSLCCDLYINGAEASALAGNYQHLDEWLDILFEKSKHSVDTQFRAYAIQVKTLFSRDNIVEAVDRGIEALKVVGIDFPSKNFSPYNL